MMLPMPVKQKPFGAVLEELQDTDFRLSSDAHYILQRTLRHRLQALSSRRLLAEQPLLRNIRCSLRGCCSLAMAKPHAVQPPCPFRVPHQPVSQSW